MNYILPKIKRNIKNTPFEHKMVIDLIDTLYQNQELKEQDYLYLLDNISNDEIEYLFQKGYDAKYPHYQNRVFLRALIEISNYCKMGCKYCGINYTNKEVARYRMTKEEILACCQDGYNLGYRTFVLQGGEDSYFSDAVLVDIINSIKEAYPDTRVTLSLGERSYESYKALKEAGANRYLLRHETASKRLYDHLHADFMSFENRQECLQNLRELGFQAGAGFMVGSPTQTNEDLVKDLVFLKGFDPHMVGIGPYLCHSDTELAGNESGTLTESLIMVAIVRMILPKALLPATTALGTLDKLGRENALKVGANVLMPNISPSENKELYEIYQGKTYNKSSIVQDRENTEKKVKAVGHEIDLSVGDYCGLKGMTDNV